MWVGRWDDPACVSLSGWLAATLGDMALTLIVNGQSRVFETHSKPVNLEMVIGELGLKGDRVAVERNGEIVPRASWGETSLDEGDRLEVVHFVGGGSGVEISLGLWASVVVIYQRNR